MIYPVFSFKNHFSHFKKEEKNKIQLMSMSLYIQNACFNSF